MNWEVGVAAMAATKTKATEPSTAGFWPDDARGRYVTTAHVACYLGVTERWVQDARERGLLPPVHKWSHKNVRHDKVKIEAWAEDRCEE